jgi:hypothetical protein
MWNVIWDMTPCNVVAVNQHFGGVYHLHLLAGFHFGGI